jgi:hypothetical protein
VGIPYDEFSKKQIGRSELKMSWLEGTIATGLAVAVATTLDDNIYLTSFFGRVSRTVTS